MQQHVKAIKAASATIEANQAKLTKIAEQRAKFSAARDAAAQSAEALQVKASRALAMAACGEGDQRAADALAADADVAARTANAVRMTLEGLTEAEVAANAAIEQAKRDLEAATLAAVEARFDQLAQEYVPAALAFIAALRKVHAIDRIIHGLNPNRAVFRNNTDARELIIPALTHPDCEPHLCGGYNTDLYSARGELANITEHKQGEALRLEREALRAAGVPI